DGGPARPETLHLFDRVPAVGSALAGRDAEALLEAAHDLPRAGERAGDVDAHLHVAAADRMLVVHRIEGDDLAHLDRTDAENRRDFARRLERQVAELPLHEVERDQERRARLRIL